MALLKTKYLPGYFLERRGMRLARTADPFIYTFQAGRYSMQGSAALTLPSAPAFVQTSARSQTDWTREPESRGTVE
jgi:hypothetical protein